MRKIASKEQEEKRKKRNQWVVGSILIFVMFFSVFGYAFYGGGGTDENNNKKIIYNGFEFIEQNGFWFVNVQGVNFVFRNNPNDAEKIHSNLNNINNYVGKPLYIQSESKEADIEIDDNLRQMVLRKQPACLDKETCTDDSPIKTCEDNFIIIKENNETSVRQEENCVFIQGPQEDLVKITDGFLLKILGI